MKSFKNVGNTNKSGLRSLSDIDIFDQRTTSFLPKVLHLMRYIVNPQLGSGLGLGLGLDSERGSTTSHKTKYLPFLRKVNPNYKKSLYS